MIFNYDSLSFEILSVERVKHKDGTFSVKERPYAALSIRINGKSSFTIDNKHITAKTGDILFIPANKIYEVKYSGSEYIVVHLIECNYTEAESITPNNKDALLSIFVQMLEHWRKRKSSNKAKSYLYDILYKLEEELIETKSKRPAEFEKCLNFLDKNFCNPNLKIETLCDFGYISRSTLQRYFFKYIGISPKQYLLQLKLNKAIDLLANENSTISLIAESCGFSDEKYFSRIFKQTYGISPTDARHRKHF